MPSFIWDLIFKLAVQFGVPYLIQKFPFLKKFLSEDLLKVIEEFIKNMSSHNEGRAEIKRSAISKAKKCVGSLCIPEVKK